MDLNNEITKDDQSVFTYTGRQDSCFEFNVL